MRWHSRAVLTWPATQPSIGASTPGTVCEFFPIRYQKQESRCAAKKIANSMAYTPMNMDSDSAYFSKILRTFGT